MNFTLNTSDSVPILDIRADRSDFCRNEPYAIAIIQAPELLAIESQTVPHEVAQYLRTTEHGSSG